MAQAILRLAERLERGRAQWAMIGLGLVLALPCIGTRFVFDDNTQALVQRADPGLPGHAHRAPWDLFVFTSGNPAENRELIQHGVLLPWWGNPELKLSFFRPLASLTHAADAALWPTSALAMHVHTLVWYGLLLMTVAAAYRRLAAKAALPGLAILLYVLDDAHAQTVSWIANRNALMASVFAISALLAHARFRESKRMADAALAAFALALGLACGEFAIGVLGYFLAYALFLDPRGRRSGLVALWPYGALLVVWRFVYKALHYGARGSDAYLDPSAEPWLFLRAFPKRLLTALLGQFTGPPSDLAFWAVPHNQWVIWLADFIVVGSLVIVIWPWLRTDRHVRFWTVGLLLCTVPTSASFSSDRTLLLVGIGGMALVATLFARLLPAVASGAGVPTFHAIVLWLLVFVHLVVGPVVSPLRARMLEITGRAMERMNQSLPTDPSVTAKTVIILNAPVDIFAGFLPIMRAREGIPLPAHLYWLATASSLITVTRTGDRMLRVSPEHGYLYTEHERFWRAARAPFRVGDVVQLAGLSATIAALTNDGRPASVDFRFERPLSDEHYVWMSWQTNRYVPATLPALGASLHFREEDFVRLVNAEIGD